MADTRAPATLAVSIATLVICTIFVFFRFLTRSWIVRKIQVDDWLILLAWVLAVGFSVSICIATAYGLGRHSADIPDNEKTPLRKAEYAFSVLYNPALMATKTSIIIFFLEVSRDEPLFRWCNYLTLAITNIAGLALTFLNIFQCRPVSVGFVYPTPADAKCTDIVTLYLSSAPVNIITDLAILFLPMPILTRMRLPKKQKIILVVTFSFGIFVTVVDVVRIAYLENAALNRLQLAGTKGQNARIATQNDFPWYASLSFMWSAVEVNLGIVCACVPMLKPLFLRFLPSFIKDVNDPDMMSGNVDMDRKITPELPDMDGEKSMLTNPAAFKSPTNAEYRGNGGEDEMGFLDFLSGPPEEGAPLGRATTAISRMDTRKTKTSEFDFFDINRPKSMVKLSNQQSFRPVILVTIIFFLWGFAYGLLGVLNGQFQNISKLSQAETLGLHAAYYGGYFVGPLTLGQFMLKKYGFKAAMITGLCVYSCGTLVFWPSAVLTSYTAFVISNFIVAFGLSCLEIAANPFIALCGPLEYAEVRLNFSQGFQAIGTVLSPLLAQKVFFKNVQDAPSLVNVQWTYLGIALFDVMLAVIFYYLTLPEASDEELEELADRRSAAYRTKIGPFHVIWVTLALGVFSQFCYVGGQEAIGNNTERVSALLHPLAKLSDFDYTTVGHTVFAVGRFLSAFFNYLFKPRWILLFLYAGLIITCSLQMRLGGDAGEAMNMLTYFFESGIFSIIFAISLRGMGAHTKTASSLITAAIGGGALFSPIQTVVANKRGLKYSFAVPLAAFAFGTVFAIYLNLFPAARNQVDPVHERRAQRRAERQARGPGFTAESTATNNQFGLAGILARRKKHQSDIPSLQHVERRDESTSPSFASTPENTEVPKMELPRNPSPVRQTARMEMPTSKGAVGQFPEMEQPKKQQPWKKQTNEAKPQSRLEKDLLDDSDDDASSLTTSRAKTMSRVPYDHFEPKPATERGDGDAGRGSPALEPWPDDDQADHKERQILFGKSISAAL